MRKEQTSINTLHYNDEIYTDSEAKANILNNQFVSVFTNEDQSPLPHFSNKPAPDISDLTINIDGAFNLLSKIEPSKTAGPDETPQITYGSFTHLYFSVFTRPRPTS